jgi:hypothetical protein
MYWEKGKYADGAQDILGPVFLLLYVIGNLWFVMWGFSQTVNTNLFHANPPQCASTAGGSESKRLREVATFHMRSSEVALSWCHWPSQADMPEYLTPCLRPRTIASRASAEGWWQTAAPADRNQHRIR